MGSEYRYKVAVQCDTFNHSKFILEALNGFVMQQTTFPFVVMVIDDASTDGNQDVIQQFFTSNFNEADEDVALDYETDCARFTYAQHNTNKNCYMVVMYLKENHYSQRKPRMHYLDKWRNTKYIAICEGDDYWTDPYKLQKQVDILEANSNCGLVHTELDYLYQKSQIRIKNFWKSRGLKQENMHGDIFKNLLLRGCGKNPACIYTCTVCYRRSLFEGNEIFDGSKELKLPYSDYPLFLSILAKSKAAYINESTTVHRQIAKSATQGQSFDYKYNFNYIGFKKEYDYFKRYTNISEKEHSDFLIYLDLLLMSNCFRHNSHHELYFSLYNKLPSDRKSLRIKIQSILMKFPILNNIFLFIFNRIF